MTAPRWTKGPPRRILLATDLSARCDRALDRAALLAREPHAQLVVLHALERAGEAQRSEIERRLPSWRRPPGTTMARIAEDQIRQELADANLDIKVVVEPGEPADLVLRTAESLECDLIVTGLARDEALGRFGLGNTVNQLLRRSGVPLLIVKQRARAPYRSIVVATDFSEASRPALQVATAFFPDRRLHVLHAFDPPSSRLAGDAARYEEERRKSALATCAAFMRAAGIAEERSREFELLMECGYPRDLVHQYVRDRGVDLVVLGTHGRGALVDALIGSTAKDILFALACDALIVRAARG